VLDRAEPASTRRTAASRTSRRAPARGDGIEDRNLPSAYEAIARAQGVAGNTAESAR
jgi:hypothetical protein